MSDMINIEVKNIHCVVAKYKEDVSWVNSLDITYTIYNKDEDYSNNEFTNLPNIGREAHTYLYHIIENYDKLDDFVCFLQGNPFDHLIIPLSNIKYINVDEYLPIGQITTCDINGSPQILI